MKNNKIKTISLGIFFFICFSNITNFIPTENFNESLQVSAGEISIITPENKTYTTAMNGYYPATFGFENDADGSSPEGWDNPTGGGSYLRVVSEKFGRKKVIEAYDAGGSTGWWASYDFDNTEGTIEFWWAISSVAPSQSQSVFILNSTGDLLFGVQVLSGQIQVQTGGTWLDISGLTTTANTWDHVRLDFRSSSGSAYQGMNQNQYRIYYNGIDKGTYNFQNIGDPNNTRLYSGLAPAGIYGYIDAFAFSWDPNYNVGDNLKEGLLLSFENSTQLDWIGYSLDGQANKTIIGNTTFSTPNTGLHSIQVFGSDPIFTMYQSQIVYFTIDYHDIYIITPENKTYPVPMSGYYPATLGFETDADGSSPEGWDNPTGAGSYLRVVSEKFGHKKVIEAYDAGAGTGWWASYYFNNTEGTIEFWWAISSVALLQAQSVLIFDSIGDPLFGVQVISGQIQVYTGGSWLDISGLTTTANTWDHVRLDFRSSSGSAYQGMNQNQYRIYYNGIDKGTYNFQNIGDPNNTRLYSGLAPAGIYGYIDAFAFSWDPNYDIGDNLNEGLLLSYEDTMEFDWIGYSLDGQANSTILGNTTIPMPEDGLHSIQVFGSNLLGTIFESNMQYFSVDIGSPEITITIPSQNEFFGVVPPNFEISILKPDITNIWYTLDNGLTNITSAGLTGTINQIEWDKIFADLVTIRFYANDTLGFEGYTEVVIKKDLNSPQSSISQDELIFTISANDGLGSGVSVIRYKINGSGWIDYTVPFSLDYGIWNITYQAIDAVGNVESENTLLISLKEPDDEPVAGGIPSSPLIATSLILFGTITIIIFYLRKKHSIYRK